MVFRSSLDPRYRQHRLNSCTLKLFHFFCLFVPYPSASKKYVNILHPATQLNGASSSE